eukprot:2102227-Prymnesium_polylepis.1
MSDTEVANTNPYSREPRFGTLQLYSLSLTTKARLLHRRRQHRTPQRRYRQRQSLGHTGGATTRAALRQRPHDAASMHTKKIQEGTTTSTAAGMHTDAHNQTN